MAVKIITDSSSDIAPEVAQELGITVVPLYVCFGDKVYRDRVDIKEDEFYRRLVEGPFYPTTSQPAPADLVEVYSKLAEETDEIVSIHASSKLSGTYNAALLAKEAVSKKCHIEVVDSQWVTIALGLIAMGAAKAAETGDSLQQVIDGVRQAITQTRLLVALDTLKYLAKGGRIGKAKSLLGTVLNVKPLVAMREGEIVPVGLARSRAKAIERLFEFARSAKETQEVAIVHSTTPEESRTLAERIAALFPIRRPHISRLGPVVGTHAGPGTAFVAVQRGDEEVKPGNAEDRPVKRRFSLPSLRSPRLTLSCSLPGPR